MRRRVQAREEAHGRLADLLAGGVAQRDDEVARAERGDAARAEPATAHHAREQLEPGVARLWAAYLCAAYLCAAGPQGPTPACRLYSLGSTRY